MNALWFIIVILAFIMIQNRLYEKNIFNKLFIDRSFEVHGAFPEETVTYKFSIVNKKALPMTWLEIQEKLPIQLQFDKEERMEAYSDASVLHYLTLSILPYQKVNRRYTVKCLKRGYYELRDLTLNSTNLLGSKTYSQERQTPVAIAVYPNIRDLGDEFIPANTMMGDFSVNRWIIDDPMMIIGVRDYQSTDSFKSVNWKLTARNQKMLVNKYDHTADKKIMIIFNIEKSEYTMEISEVKLVEEAIEIAASIAVKLVENGIPTGLATNAVCIGEKATGLVEPNTGHTHINDLLTTFAQISNFKKLHSRELLKLLIKDFSWGTEIIVVTLTANNELMEDLQQIGDTKTTIIAMKESKVDYIPPNVSLFYYGKEGEKYEAI
jgi:uncharacterized protein (DUF58 family)